MIAVVNSKVANINSVVFGLERLGLNYVLTNDAQEIRSAERVILPGVGHARIAMKNLRELDLIATLRGLTQPTLGICLGMQLLFEFTEEGDVEGLGVIPGRVRALRSQNNMPVPHMGWNQVNWSGSSPRLSSDYFYFVHSYAADVNQFTWASTEYGGDFSAVVQRDNFLGVQFHPEKSGAQGEELLRFFLEMT